MCNKYLFMFYRGCIKIFLERESVYLPLLIIISKEGARHPKKINDIKIISFFITFSFSTF